MPSIRSNMAGTIIEVSVGVGQTVEVGQDVACLESMKMQMFITAEEAGTVTAVNVGAGDFVNEGDIILELA